MIDRVAVASCSSFGVIDCLVVSLDLAGGGAGYVSTPLFPLPAYGAVEPVGCKPCGRRDHFRLFTFRGEGSAVRDVRAGVLAALRNKICVL